MFSNHLRIKKIVLIDLLIKSQKHQFFKIKESNLTKSIVKIVLIIKKKLKHKKTKYKN